MKGMFLKNFYIYYSKWATVAQKFQLSMAKLGTNDEIRWNDGNYDWNLQVGEKEAPKELYVAMTSDRGLAGAVHSSICKAIRYKSCSVSDPSPQFRSRIRILMILKIR